MRNSTSFGYVFLALLALTGCSSGSSKSESNVVSVNLIAGQEDVSGALLRSVQVLTNGLLDEESDGRLRYNQAITGSQGEASIAVLKEKMQYFQALSRQADSAVGRAASTVSCQVVTGCSNVAFGEAFHQVIDWRSVAFNLNKNETLVVTPFTDWAAELAQTYFYVEDQAQWQDTGYFSPYSIVQSVSQVSNLLGLLDVQSKLPANLARLNSLSSKDAVTAKDAIRYGALLAAWQERALADPDFAQQAVAELRVNKGRLYQTSTTAVLSLADLIGRAKTNLAAVPVSNQRIKGYVAEVLDQFEQDLTKLTSNQLTNVTPAKLEELLGKADYEGFKLGIERTKGLLAELKQNYLAQDFFTDGYKAKLDTYRAFLKTVEANNKSDFEAILSQIRDTQKLYVDSVLAGSCQTLPAWVDVNGCLLNDQRMTLTANGNTLTVAQAQAPTSPQAVDVLIEGSYQSNALTLKLKHRQHPTTKAIESASGVRIYYGQVQNKVSADEALAYELRWADFGLQDTDSQTQVSGALGLFYRGVKPTGKARHYNIERFDFNGLITEKDSADASKIDRSTVMIAASSLNAQSYYNETEEFGRFNGFFTEYANAPSSVAKLASYALGNETIYNQNIEYFDFIVKNSEHKRYRFYPTVTREDVLDYNKNGNYQELIATYDLAICTLENNQVTECSPKQRFYGQRDRNRAINELWEAGEFSSATTEQGEYFIAWPATQNAQGCFKLNALDTTGQFTGELISPAVLGLNRVRFTTEILLKDNAPKTTLDVLLRAPTKARYNLTLALSHNYNSLTQDDLYLGYGGELNRLYLNYNTDSDFKRIGNLSVYKSGVQLRPSEKGVGEIIAGVNQPYSNLQHKYLNGADGGYQLCVTANSKPDDAPAFDKKSAIYALSFRGVVYGSLRYESNAWVVRYLDGTLDSLL